MHPISKIDVPNSGLEFASKINNDSVPYVHLDENTMKAIGYGSGFALQAGERTENYYKLNTTGSIIISGNVRVYYILIFSAFGLIIGAFAAFLKKKNLFRKGDMNV